MKNLFTTTTGALASMSLDHCGDYAGRYINQAHDLLSEVCDLPEFKNNHWADIMYDRNGNVYAVWAEDAMTCQNARALYIQLSREDYEEAFWGMEEKISNI